MSTNKQFTLKQLTEGISKRNLSEESRRLVDKWARVGLLKGLDGVHKENMARLLENQAAEILRESNSISTGAGGLTSTGQLAGFVNIAFPIVRRVFGSLVANELVSIQPMSLPSGLLFYLDYSYGKDVGGDDSVGVGGGANQTYNRGDSLYGSPNGRSIRGGATAVGGMYDLVNTGYTRVHAQGTAIAMVAPGAYVNTAGVWTWSAASTVSSSDLFADKNGRLVGFDPQVQKDVDESVLDYCFAFVLCSAITGATGMGGVDLMSPEQLAVTAFGTVNGAIAWGSAYQGGTGLLNLRRLTRRGSWNGSVFTPDAIAGTHMMFVIRLSNGGAVPASTLTISGAVADTLSMATGDGAGSGLTVPSFETDFGATPSPAIPEIDIKIESISVTASTRKLRAKWTPEMAQDLNAFHSMDVEVELTQILSEQITLEIDREILNDILLQASGASLFWSRAPGKFVNKETGATVNLESSLAAGPHFAGTVREWYETLIETIIDAGNTIHRKTLRGSANFVVTSPDVCTILEASVYYKANVDLDKNGQAGTPFSIGCEAVGQLSNRFTVYKDPYFPRNKILIGYKGGSYLESGYIYAPYVPLIVTPTIFAPEDFSPRKGVMTRYGKKLTRADFYGTVTVLDLNII
jgi:hypothetical protein